MTEKDIIFAENKILEAINNLPMKGMNFMEVYQRVPPTREAGRWYRLLVRFEIDGLTRIEMMDRVHQAIITLREDTTFRLTVKDSVNTFYKVKHRHFRIQRQEDLAEKIKEKCGEVEAKLPQETKSALAHKSQKDFAKRLDRAVHAAVSSRLEYMRSINSFAECMLDVLKKSQVPQGVVVDLERRMPADKYKKFVEAVWPEGLKIETHGKFSVTNHSDKPVNVSGSVAVPEWDKTMSIGGMKEKTASTPIVTLPRAYAIESRLPITAKTAVMLVAHDDDLLMVDGVHVDHYHIWPALGEVTFEPEGDCWHLLRDVDCVACGGTGKWSGAFEIHDCEACGGSGKVKGR